MNVCVKLILWIKRQEERDNKESNIVILLCGGREQVRQIENGNECLMFQKDKQSWHQTQHKGPQQGN